MSLRTNPNIRRMLQENKSNQQSSQYYNPKRNYHHSSMEFGKENEDLQPGGDLHLSNKMLNGNVQSLRSSAGNLNTYYSSQTPISGSNRGSSTSKLNYTSTPFSNKSKLNGSKTSNNKLSAKQIIDEPPRQNESFDDTMLDDSYLSLGVGESEDGPAIRAETVHRGIDFSNNKMVLNNNLDAFMDRQLQIVAEKLADKKSIEKYNMVLRMNMKTHMENIQEMLDDSTNIQARVILKFIYLFRSTKKSKPEIN